MAQHLEVNVIKYPDRQMEVAIFLPDFNQMMVVLSPEAARTMAFSLVQCADHIEPPFGEDESDSFFGPYDEETEEDDDPEDEEDE
jgi:hypothetical protein